MSRGYYRRRSIFRPDAGRAFLRFAIGIILLVALCALFYIFVLQGKIDIELPVPPQRPAATATPDLSTPAPTVAPTDEPTPVPTIEPTAEPTATPTPAPTATPIPAEELAGPMEEVMAGLPDEIGANLKLGLKELSVFDEGGQSVVVVRGYAYIEGADAANSHSYILLTNAASGALLGMYPVTPKAEDADLAFEESSGANLDQAFFQLNLDAASLEDGYYIVSMAVENGGKVAWNYFDDSMYHFSVTQGAAALSE